MNLQLNSSIKKRVLPEYTKKMIEFIGDKELPEGACKCLVGDFKEDVLLLTEIIEELKNEARKK